MANFDVAIGADFATFNAIFASVWSYVQTQNVFPKQFVSGSGQWTDTITVNVTQPPTLASTAPPLPDGYPPPSGPVLIFPNVSMTRTDAFDGTITGTGPLVVQIMIEPTQNNSLVVQIGEGAFVFSNGEVLYSTTGIIPIDNYLNQLLGAISIPALSFGGMNFQTSLEVGPSNDGFLMVYGALSQAVQPPSGGTAWPASTWFVALDAAVLNAFAANLVQNLSGSRSKDWFTASYSVQVTTANLSIGTGNSITGSLNFSGSAALTFHNHIPYVPNPTASVSFSGSCDFSVSLSVQSDGANQDIYLTVNDVGNFTLSLGGVDGFFDPITDGLADAIEGMISSKIDNYSTKVYTLSPTSFSIAGSTVTIAPQNIVINTMAGPGDVEMAIITFSLATSAA